MRVLFIIILFALALNSLAQTTPIFTNGSTALATNGSTYIYVPPLPMAKFKFDGNTQDTSGYSNNLTASGSVSYTNGPNGVAGTAIVLGGSFLNFTNTFATYFDTKTQFTVTWWQYITNVNTRQYIVGNLDSNQGFIGWNVESTGSQKNGLILNRITTSSEISVVNNGSIAINTWYFVSFSYNGNSNSSGTFCSLNGTAVAIQTSLNTLNGSILTTNLARVGLRSDGLLPFTGRLTGLSIWPKCLSTNDFYYVYTNGLNGNF